MNTDEQLYILAGQAEEIQKHAVILQEQTKIELNKLHEEASNAIFAIDEATKRIGREIQKRGVFWIICGFLTILCILIFAVYAQYKLAEFETKDLKLESAKIKKEIQEEKDALKDIQSKNWGFRLHEDKSGKFIILPKGVKAEAGWHIGKEEAIKIVTK